MGETHRGIPVQRQGRGTEIIIRKKTEKHGGGKMVKQKTGNKKETYRQYIIEIDEDVEWEKLGASERRKTLRWCVNIVRSYGRTMFSEATREELFAHILEDIGIKLPIQETKARK